MRRLFRRLAVVLPIALAACGGATEVPTIETTSFAPSLGVDLNAMTRTPSGLYYRDLAASDGAVSTNGQRLQMRYAGYLADGTLFDQNTAPAAPFAFTLGAGQVIPGWDQGVAGMRVGGRRQLVIPPALGYGANRVGPIPANSILVFTVEVVSA
jgi:peptidylprolyl isomerase